MANTIMYIKIDTSLLPSGGVFYDFKEIVLRTMPLVIPAEPITKPTPTITPKPKENDPFNVPAPLIDPTPKGLFVLF